MHRLLTAPTLLALLSSPTGVSATDGTDPCCPIVELRQYTLHPGQRDTLIELFDREFVRGQEAAGMDVLGQFRDLDRPDRFVWLRGFPSMDARAQSLAAFYGGPIWKQHRAAANATMLDSANVLLLRPTAAGTGLRRAAAESSPASVAPTATLTATVYSLASPRAVDDLALFFEREVRPELVRAGLSVAATYRTEASLNTFPALPVREGENVFVWLSDFLSSEALRESAARLEASPEWRDRVSPALLRQLSSPPEVLRLSPTPGSRLQPTPRKDIPNPRS